MTTHESLDRQTRTAVAALAHRIRERDQQDDPTDADIFALEYLHALRGQGWRPTNARRPQPWSTDQGPRSEDTARRGAHLARDLLGLPANDHQEQE
ncbi:hypothetical protein ACIBG8_07335 [Nonomuraea sp. NPDC050556]|uniref:hypothetical protein n=1 Tax=Nonomuraea sp. NPDC050556 TaxID=3364369 RepID=UPI0037AEAFC6